MPNIVSVARLELPPSQPLFDLRARNRANVHAEVLAELVKVAAERLPVAQAHSVLLFRFEKFFDYVRDRFADRFDLIALAVFFCGCN
jgi:hypothetical protein